MLRIIEIKPKTGFLSKLVQAVKLFWGPLLLQAVNHLKVHSQEPICGLHEAKEEFFFRRLLASRQD